MHGLFAGRLPAAQALGRLGQHASCSQHGPATPKPSSSGLASAQQLAHLTLLPSMSSSAKLGMGFSTMLL